jgi:hypothetical protein
VNPAHLQSGIDMRRLSFLESLACDKWKKDSGFGRSLEGAYNCFEH